MRRLFEPTAGRLGAKGVVAAALAFGLAATPARAEAPADAPGAAPARPLPKFSLRGQIKPEPPGLDVITMLVRTTLIAVSQGNETGDYTVLYALASPQLKKTATIEQLAEALKGFRARGIDLSPVAIFPPQFVRKPQLDKDGVLQLLGFFPTRPLQIRFSLAYRQVDGAWRLEGLNVDTAQAPPEQAAVRPETGMAPAPPRPPAPRPGPAPAPKPDLDRRTDPPTTTKY